MEPMILIFLLSYGMMKLTYILARLQSIALFLIVIQAIILRLFGQIAMHLAVALRYIMKVAGEDS